MQWVVLGLNHKTVPVEIREKFAMTAESIRSGLRHIHDLEGIEEAVILSTCNRTEMYAVLSSGAGKESLQNFFLTVSGNTKADAKPEYFYYFEGEACIRHLFDVVSGLDSMVLGESQILNQVKTAYTMALAEKATGTILNTLFHRAITCGKRVRTETHISYNAVSVSYAAVQMAQHILGSLEGRTALIFGAGETAELTVKNLQGKGLKSVIVTNRHLERAQALALKMGGRAVPFDRAFQAADEADILISSTGATQYIIKPWDMRQLMNRRSNRPVIVIDIAVPRDSDPEVGNIKGVTLINIDDLQQIVEENIRFREGEAERAKLIIEEEIASIEERFTYLSTRPVMVSLSDKAEHIRAREQRKALAKIEGLTEEDEKIIDHMTHVIVRKLLREPMIRLNSAAGTPEELAEKANMERIFQLDIKEAAGEK